MDIYKEFEVTMNDLRVLLYQSEAIRNNNNGYLYKVNDSHNIYGLDDDDHAAALEQLDQEEALLSSALEKAYEVRKIKKKLPRCASKGIRLSKINCIGLNMPVWNGNYFDSPPPLCGSTPALPNYIAPIGDMVAAKVMFINKDTKKDEDMWILGRVVYYDGGNSFYKIQDIYDEKNMYFIAKNHIIPLPTTAANPETHHEALFPKGTKVLAIYPQVTVFYTAKVKETPVKPMDCYKLIFKDSRFDESNDGYDLKSYNVCQKFVIQYPEELKEKSPKKMRKRKKKRKKETAKRMLVKRSENKSIEIAMESNEEMET